MSAGPSNMPQLRHGALLLGMLLVFAVVSGAWADLKFPSLTGRVVDAAGVLDAATRATLDQKLAAQEAKGTDQVVVATVPSLQGTSIEDFAKAHKLVVTRNEPAAARLGIAGTVDDVSDAFGVTLFDYSHPNLGDFHARTGPVHVPTEVGDAITGDVRC